MLLLQIVGAVFGLGMLFITWHYYAKNAYTYRSLTAWFFVWIAFIVFALFPEMLTPVVQTLSISRVFDAFVVGGLFVVTTAVFYLYVTVKKTEKRVEELVSELAKKPSQE